MQKTAQGEKILSPKERLAAYVKTLELDDLDRLIRRLGRAPRSTPIEKTKEGTSVSKYMTHREFKPAIKAKLDELIAQYGTGIFKRSGALRVGEARKTYVAWYLAERQEHINSHEKQYDEAYYERQGLSLARIVIQEQRAAA